MADLVLAVELLLAVTSLEAVEIASALTLPMDGGIATVGLEKMTEAEVGVNPPVATKENHITEEVDGPTIVTDG